MRRLLLCLIGLLSQNLQALSDLIRASKKEISTNNGMDYLEVKYRILENEFLPSSFLSIFLDYLDLLLKYCLLLSFYMSLKIQGQSVENHPVINELLRTSKTNFSFSFSLFFFLCSFFVFRFCWFSFSFVLFFLFFFLVPSLHCFSIFVVFLLFFYFSFIGFFFLLFLFFFF